MKFFTKKMITPQKTPQTTFKTSRKDLIKRTINDVLTDSLSKAIIKIFYSPSIIIRVFWCLGLLFACGLCSYFLIESILVFFTYELSTTVRTYAEVTSLFPKVTICNKNAFTTKYAFEVAAGLKYDEFQFRVNNEFNESQREKTSHSLDDILFECSFNSEKCTAKDFRKEYDKALGFQKLNIFKSPLLKPTLRDFKKNTYPPLTFDLLIGQVLVNGSFCRSGSLLS
jgi:hypothetical protein